MLGLSQIFQPHMALQRDKTVHIFGTADPGAAVRAVFVNESSSTADTKAAADGSFCLELPPVCAGTGYVLTVTCGSESVVLDDIVVGGGKIMR